MAGTEREAVNAVPVQVRAGHVPAVEGLMGEPISMVGWQAVGLVLQVVAVPGMQVA